MAQQIRRFGIGQTAKVFGVLYALMGLVFAPIFLLVAMFGPRGSGMGIGFAIVLPVLYGVMGFLGTALACALYNFVAGVVGGVEIEMAADVASTPVA